jgi:drug/metabolite transporter (DMT)-like permease
MFDVIATCTCFIGVLCVAQPAAVFGHGPSEQQDTGAILIALIGAFLASCGYIVIRVMGPVVEPNVVVLWFACIGQWLPGVSHSGGGC